jgi:ribosome biogenesis GTPase A
MEAKRLVKEREAVQKDKEEKGEVEEVKEKFNDDGSKKESAVYDLESKKRIHVGVIGYPNAGKSTVINFITRRSAAKTAKQAGFTKGMQKIRLSDGILIIDTPGVIPRDKYSTESNTFARDVKVGGRTYSDVKNPEDVIFYLIHSDEPKDPENPTKEEIHKIADTKRNSDAIDKFYGVSSNGDTEILIEELGKKLGHFGKGKKVDVDRTARVILRDWQEGKIRV